MFKTGQGDWTRYRQCFNISPEAEIDLHFGRRDRGTKSYDEAMDEIRKIVRIKLENAQENGSEYLMFCHGYSTSKPGKTTTRSVVRGFMRSKDATPLIERGGCIQHDTVFVAKIRHYDARN
jgi:hypothetical protein